MPHRQERVLVLGATSGIGRALSQRLAPDSAVLVLVARNTDGLERLRQELESRPGLSVHVEAFDALDFPSHGDLIDRCWRHCEQQVDGVVVCHGWLPDSTDRRVDCEEIRRAVDVNFTSIVSLLELVSERMVRQGRGWIAVISSVAGDRGRQSNVLYGSAKAGLSTYLQGLRNRLYSAGVHVLTVKPGFVDTPMLHSVPHPPTRLVASPDRVAGDILRAIRRRRNVLYTPWFWRPIAWVLRSIPEWVFKRLKT